jgi:hypothetical protein
MEYFNKYTEYTGEQFNKIVNENNLILVKVLNDEENNFQYKDGLNIDTNEFNPNGECEKGGLYFTDYIYFINFYIYKINDRIIRIIEIPNDARVYVDNEKYKADKIILNEKFKKIEKFYEKYVNNKEIFLKIVKTNGYALTYISENFKDYAICLEAVKNKGFALNYVSENLKDYDICFEAVKKNGESLAFVSKNIINYDICLKAVKNNGNALKWVPENLKDYNICLEAINNSSLAFNLWKNFVFPQSESRLI